MQDEQWEKFKEELRRKFKVLEEKTEDLMMETSEGLVKQGMAEVLIFSAKGGSASGGEELPFSKMKLVRENRPVVLDKKFIYSHRAGQAARTEYRFSDSEFSHKLRAYKWDEDEDRWSEIDTQAFSS